jgi:hypothetical protein
VLGAGRPLLQVGPLAHNKDHAWDLPVLTLIGAETP